MKLKTKNKIAKNKKKKEERKNTMLSKQEQKSVENENILKYNPRFRGYFI